VSIERVPKCIFISSLLDFVEVSDWSIYNIFMLIPDATPKGEFLDSQSPYLLQKMQLELQQKYFLTHGLIT